MNLLQRLAEMNKTNNTFKIGVYTVFYFTANLGGLPNFHGDRYYDIMGEDGIEGEYMTKEYVNKDNRYCKGCQAEVSKSMYLFLFNHSKTLFKMERSIQEKIKHYQSEIDKWTNLSFEPKAQKICGCCGQKIPDELYKKRVEIEREHFKYKKNAEIQFCKVRLNELRAGFS